LAVIEREQANWLESGVVEYDGFIHDSQSVWSAHQASPVAAANIRIGNVMCSLRYPKADTFNVDFGISER
jgi:hypothetical protein